MRKVDAQRWLDEQTSAIVTQTWTAPERGRVTVDVWAEQWLAAQTGLKPSTLYRYRSLLRVQILPRWGRHRLADVTHAEVAAWVAQLVAGGLAPATVRQAHRVLALVLTLAVRDGRIPRNPASGVPLPRARRADPRFLTRTEVERLADAAGEDGDVVRLLAYTGLRVGEMAALPSAGSISSASGSPSPRALRRSAAPSSTERPRRTSSAPCRSRASSLSPCPAAVRARAPTTSS